jgi:hypothetical protein
VRRAWICYLLPIMFVLGCEAIAKFDRDKIGQPSAPLPMIPRRDGGPMSADAAAEEEEEEEEEDAGEEELDAGEEDLDAGAGELDAEQSDAGEPAEGVDGSLDGAAASVEAGTDAAPEHPDAQGGDAAS